MALLEDAAMQELLARLSGQSAAAAPQAPPAGGSPTPPQPAPGRAYRVGRALGRGARALGVPGVLFSQGMGAADQAAATEAGAREDNRPERALQILGGMDVTGLGARLGRVLTGGSFFNPSSLATVVRSGSGYGARVTPNPFPPTPAAAAGLTESRQAAIAPLPAVNAGEILRRNYAPERGTGAISLNGGPAQAIDSRPRSMAEAQASLEANQAIYNDRFGAQPGFVGSLIRLRGIQSQQASQQAATLKGPAAQKDVLESMLLGVRMREAERARAAGADPAEISAIASGRATGPSFTAVPSMTGDIDVVQTRGPGAGQQATRLKPQQPVTEAHIAADMRNKKLSREQVLAEYQRRGFDISRFK